MTAAIRPTPYAIDIQPLSGEVSIHFNDTVLARSTNAKVMYETRLAPSIYVPVKDVLVGLGDATDLQTFCPFKGTASYRNLTFADHDIENAVWSYDDALPESAGIRGYLGFMPHAVTHVDTGQNTLHAHLDGNISGPVIDWLMRGAGSLPTPEAFTAALAGKLIESGVPLSRLSVMIWSLHPLIAGKNHVWDRATAEVNTFAPSYEIHDHPAFVNSPLRHVSNGRGGVRQKLGQDYAENSFPIMADLRANGATDYVAMPLTFLDGRTNVLTITSDHPDGFSTSDLGLVFECSPVISRFYEVFMQRENAQSLLETYVGKRTGARVLGGQIRRGDGDDIDAAIMFCDLRGSTRLEERMGRMSYIALLNQFFETASTLIDAHGGEVLKFIGDAVLAVFPAGDTPTMARAQAVRSAREIVRSLATLDAHDHDHDHEGRSECSIGIAYGRVTYGNVGSRERLDFTVIGQAANIAARLGDYGKAHGHSIVVADQALPPDIQNTDLGQVSLHNVSQPVRCHAIQTH